MGMIRIVRCTEAERIAYGGIEEGRIFFCTDSDKIWIGTAGGDLEFGAGAKTLADLTDVTVSSPSDSDVLVWDNDAGLWINEPHELVIAEIFDNLNTAVINGQGSYRRCAAWTGNEVGTGTSRVVVKAGADKMLRLTSGSPVGTNYGDATLDINSNSRISSGIFKFKARTSDVTKGFDCFQFKQGATTRFTIALGNISQMRCQWGTASWTNLVAIANNTWYTVEVHWSSASQTITVFVAGVYRGYFTLHTDSRCEYIDRLYSRCYTDSLTGDADDLEIVCYGVYPYQI